MCVDFRQSSTWPWWVNVLSVPIVVLFICLFYTSTWIKSLADIDTRQKSVKNPLSFVSPSPIQKRKSDQYFSIKGWNTGLSLIRDGWKQPSNNLFLLLRSCRKRKNVIEIIIIHLSPPPLLPSPFFGLVFPFLIKAANPISALYSEQKWIERVKKVKD